MHAPERSEVERRGAVHAADNSGELGRNSDEQFTWRGGLPRPIAVSAGCARGRRSLGQDVAARGEVEWPERQCRRWRSRWQRSGSRVQKWRACGGGRSGRGG
jgi:hypothetical protein